MSATLRELNVRITPVSYQAGVLVDGELVPTLIGRDSGRSIVYGVAMIDVTVLKLEPQSQWLFTPHLEVIARDGMSLRDAAIVAARDAMSISSEMAIALGIEVPGWMVNRALGEFERGELAAWLARQA